MMQNGGLQSMRFVCEACARHLFWAFEPADRDVDWSRYAIKMPCRGCRKDRMAVPVDKKVKPVLA